jgi:DNA polymerase
MRWDERRLAMLSEMGVRLWLPPADAQVVDPPDLVAAPGAPGRQALAAPATEPAAEPTAGVAAMGWPALREAVSACTACPLCEARRQTVFGVGSEQAHWLVVGEAPGEQEDIRGEPFVGKSGQLLDNMLGAIGLTRGEAEPARQVYITNSVKCRPPGNRNPAPEELAQCEAFLIRQVQLLRPRIILAMGRFAVQSLLRSAEPIGRLRGRVHRYQGAPLIVTYHPAYLLRNPEDKAKAWDDLCLAVETAQGIAVP